MRKVLFIGALLAASLTVSACSSGISGSSSTQSDVSTVVNQVVAGAQRACQILPSAVDVATLITTSPAFSTAGVIIKALCARVPSPKSASLRRASSRRVVPSAVTVGGVTIRIQPSS